jgi:cyclic pyranopterin phosphate synthase
VRAGNIKKGDVLGTARIAGIMAAKKTSELIPLCHSLPLDAVDVTFDVQDTAIHIRATASTTAKTGVEMECSEYWKQTQIQASEIRKLRDELRTYTDGTNDDVQREAV